MSCKLVTLVTRGRCMGASNTLVPRLSSFVPRANFHLSYCAMVGQEWRKKNLLPRNPNKYGPMADLPDYTFLDGRPTPPTPGQVTKALQQKVLAEKVMELCGEVNFAVELEKQNRAEAEARHQQILDRKLKVKGTKIIRRNEE